MRLSYRNKRIERILVAVNVLAAGAVAASFAMLFGFYQPLVHAQVLYVLQYMLLFVFVAEKAARIFNVFSLKDYLKVNWIEVPLLVALAAVLFGAGRWFAETDPAAVRHFAVGIYLVVQVVIKVCRSVVNLAASGRSPTRTLIVSFLVLIITGAMLLMLPRAASGENIGFVDALFTATSATCVTGLVVKDTGGDFSMMGQVIILSLIQLGGLGIVVFGAVFALLLGQALGVRESVAMQDLLSARTVSRITNIIVFIFFGTALIEAVGAVSLFNMWADAPGWVGNVDTQWFCSIFHSISAFCNAGFSLFSNSFIDYSKSWQIYAVICPLIILGGLGFGVLYDLCNVAGDRVKRFFKRYFNKDYVFSVEMPKRLQLQSKIVLSVSAALIVLGTVAILVFERFSVDAFGSGTSVFGALFQSVTARTAGFNTMDVSSMTGASKFFLILLMFIGGSPGSTAGGIKTVTLAVVLMTAIAALRKREEVEMFKRSVRVAVVGRAITVTLLFVTVFFVAGLALNVTERASGFEFSDIMFETASALGTVGLSCGLTPVLTTVGKLIIIAVMLIGRLGPLTLLAALTFDLKPVRYNYPDEPIIVG